MIHDTFLKENGSVLGLHRNNTSCRKKKSEIQDIPYSLAERLMIKVIEYIQPCTSH